MDLRIQLPLLCVCFGFCISAVLKEDRKLFAPVERNVEENAEKRSLDNSLPEFKREDDFDDDHDDDGDDDHDNHIPPCNCPLPVCYCFSPIPG